MGRNLTILVATTLTLAIAGCSFGDNPEANNSNQGEEEQNEKTEQQPFNNPVVAPKDKTPTPPAVVGGTPNLISSTNSTERANIVAKGRQDPFARIVSPIIPITSKQTDNSDTDRTDTDTIATQTPVPSLPPIKRSRVISASVGPSLKQKLSTKIANRTAKSKQGTKIATRNVSKPKPKPKPISVVPKTLPAVLPQPDLTSVLPPPPQPELARAVEVTGVILVGGKAQAIIKVPSEPTSRYVSSGARLSNGVFVKRIEVNEGSDPVVILEQYGIEVAKMVGEKAAPEGIEASLSVPSSVQTSIATGST